MSSTISTINDGIIYARSKISTFMDYDLPKLSGTTSYHSIQANITSITQRLTACDCYMDQLASLETYTCVGFAVSNQDGPVLRRLLATELERSENEAAAIEAAFKRPESCELIREARKLIRRARKDLSHESA